MNSDLTEEEQEPVRAALRYLRVQCGAWETLGKALRATTRCLRRVINDEGTVTASLTFRTAKLADVNVDDVLDGTYPPEGVCPHCGQRMPADVRSLT